MTVMKYSGVVRRSDGRSTLWINDRAVHDSSRAESGEPRARVDESGVASISLPEEHRTIRLQVGQTADLSSGHVAESYTRHPATPRGGVEAVPAADPVLRLRRRRDRETDVPAADPMP